MRTPGRDAARRPPRRPARRRPDQAFAPFDRDVRIRRVAAGTTGTRPRRPGLPLSDGANSLRQARSTEERVAVRRAFDGNARFGPGSSAFPRLVPGHRRRMPPRAGPPVERLSTTGARPACQHPHARSPTGRGSPPGCPQFRAQRFRRTPVATVEAVGTRRGGLVPSGWAGDGGGRPARRRDGAESRAGGHGGRAGPLRSTTRRALRRVACRAAVARGPARQGGLVLVPGPCSPETPYALPLAELRAATSCGVCRLRPKEERATAGSGGGARLSGPPRPAQAEARTVRPVAERAVAGGRSAGRRRRLGPGRGVATPLALTGESA